MMLRIRKEQMALMELHLNRRFQETLKKHMREEFPEETRDRSDEDLDRMIKHAMERGRSYGVTSEQDISLFVDLMLMLGPAFDRDPKQRWIHKILNDSHLEGAGKMDAIYRRLAVMEDRRPLPEETR